MAKRNPPKQERGLRMHKKKDNPLAKEMKIPGMNIMPDLIQGNTPLVDGVYMVYYDFDPPQAWSKTKEVAAMGVATYVDGKWGLQRTVFAYMGPIPQLALPALKEFTPPYLIAQTFFIGTIEQAVDMKFRLGPFPQYMMAFLQPAVIGDFIFCLDTEDTDPYVVSKLAENKDGDLKFKELSSKAVVKYSKMMNHLRTKK